MTFSRRSVRASVFKLMKKLRIGDFKTSYERLPIFESKKTNQTMTGCVPVYVGEEYKRFDVPVKYFSLPKFQELIKQSEGGDLDFKVDGPINLGCSTKTFDQLLKEAKKH